MKKFVKRASGVVVCACVICGCYSPKVSYIDYPTTAFAEVALKNNAKLKIVSSSGSENLVKILRDVFSRTKQFVVVDQDADYWMIVNDLSDVRTDMREQLPFTVKVEKSAVGVQDDQPGAAHEVLVEKRLASHTLAKGVSVAIYEARNLTPVYYFEIPVYNGAIQTVGGEKAATKSELAKELAGQIVVRVKDVFITQVKNISTPIPDEASSEIRKAMSSKDAAKNVPMVASKTIPQNFAEFLKDVQAGKYQDQQDALDRKLSDYYVLAIAREIGCLDAKVLKELHAQQVAILQYSTLDSLAFACPVALARLEYKLIQLGARL